MKLVATISCLLGLVLSQSQAQVDDDLCVLGPSSFGGGQYEYKGVDADGKPFYQQKRCQRTYGNVTRTIAGSEYLSFVKEQNRYFISRIVGGRDEIAKDTEPGYYYEIFCATPGISSPLECKNWTQGKGTNYIFGVYNGNCPDVLGEDNEFDGINVAFPANYEDGDLFNGHYYEIGLNMFKKAVSTTSTTSNPIYLYFSPYHFQWRFIGSTSLDEKSWVGDDPDHITCPAYSLVTEPYAESLQRGGWDRLKNVNETFKQFNELTQSYQVPLPYYYPNNIYDPNVKATKFITLTAIKTGDH